jgi:hypothetical protein
VKISNKKFSFFSTLNQYFPHIPYVESKNQKTLFFANCLSRPTQYQINKWKNSVFYVKFHVLPENGHSKKEGVVFANLQFMRQCRKKQGRNRLGTLFNDNSNFQSFIIFSLKTHPTLRQKNSFKFLTKSHLIWRKSHLHKSFFFFFFEKKVIWPKVNFTSSYFY